MSSTPVSASHGLNPTGSQKAREPKCVIHRGQLDVAKSSVEKTVGLQGQRRTFSRGTSFLREKGGGGGPLKCPGGQRLNWMAAQGRERVTGGSRVKGGSRSQTSEPSTGVKETVEEAQHFLSKQCFFSAQRYFEAKRRIPLMPGFNVGSGGPSLCLLLFSHPPGPPHLSSHVGQRNTGQHRKSPNNFLHAK